MVAAATAKLNNGLLSAPPAAATSIMIASSNGIVRGSSVGGGGGGGGAAMLLGGHSYQTAHPQSHLTAAKALAAAVAAASAAHHHHHQRSGHHPFSVPRQHSLASNSFTAKRSHAVETAKQIVLPGGGGSASKQSATTKSNTTVPNEHGSKASSFGGGGGGGAGLSVLPVRTIVATVGATSTIATLASPVPSTILLTMSSYSGGSAPSHPPNRSPSPSQQSPASISSSPLPSRPPSLAVVMNDARTQSNENDIINNMMVVSAKLAEAGEQQHHQHRCVLKHKLTSSNGGEHTEGQCDSDMKPPPSAKMRLSRALSITRDGNEANEPI
ncbi:putative lysozyme-like protein [Anopheles cruzii]|uniref:putative lysozyme-like protein n=1 Tax=Anopheles cruzii TaxID=68878 RepID=UPI0022EC58DB|nr:putative lysozyme-like protein [Anopheles cruzii]